MALLAFIIIFGSAALYYINDAKNEAVLARIDEEKAKDKAVASEKLAIAAKLQEEEAKDKAVASENNAFDAMMQEEEAKEKAIESEKSAVAARLKEEKARLEEKKAKDEAVVAKQQAEDQRSRAEYEEYISKIALAKARLERNEADGAREILLDLRSNLNSAKRTQGWEWRWLWRQANQSKALGNADSPVIDLAMDREGKIGAVACADGRVQLIHLGMQRMHVDRVA